MKDSDKRRFRRYVREYPCTIEVAGEVFPARVTDYSFTGFGLVVRGAPAIETGEVFQIHNFPLCSCGKLAWKALADTFARMGASRLEPLRGSLTHFRLSDILIDLQRSITTGVLTLMMGRAVKTVYIKNGDMVFAASNQEDDRLGDLLLSEGKITREEYDESIRLMKSTAIRQGSALARMGCIKLPQLPEIVKHQVETIIESLFGWSEAEFEFREGPLPSNEPITLKLSAANIIFKGIKRFADLEKLKARYPVDAVVGFSEDPYDAFQDISLDEAERKVLSHVDGRKTVRDIERCVGQDEGKTLRMLYALIEMSMLVVTAKEAGTGTVTSEEVLARGDGISDQDLIAEIDTLHRTLQEGMTYYKMLGVSSSSPEGEIKKAYYRTAKQYHPDRHFNLPVDTKKKLHDIFTGITDAYSILRDPLKRSAYDESLLRKPPAKPHAAPEQAEECFTEGRSLYTSGRVEAAVERFAKAVYLMGDIAMYHHYLGLAYLKTGKHRDAKASLERALKSDGGNPDTLAELGHALLGLGLPKRARGNFERALKINPSCARAREGIELVKSLPR